MRRIILGYCEELLCLNGIVLTTGWLKAHPEDMRYRIVAEKLTTPAGRKHGKRT